MNFEELDGATRRWMVEEFDTEEASGTPYRGKGLSADGLTAFPGRMRTALTMGTDDSLIASLGEPSYWNATDVRGHRINVRQAAERLGNNEFNTWYVRGLCKRLMSEGVTHCQAYRAAAPRWEPADCTSHEGQVFLAADIYAGHRACYWPEPGDPSAFSIPFQPGCHHTIRRVTLSAEATGPTMH
jgi:hypothetical protein